MKWIYIITAGMLEVGWVISLKYTEGFTKFVPMIFYAAFGFSSAYFLSLSLKYLPIGIAYAVWMSVAVIGTTVYGILYLQESMQISRLIFIFLILIGVIGLKMTAST